MLIAVINGGFRLYSVQKIMSFTIHLAQGREICSWAQAFAALCLTWQMRSPVMHFLRRIFHGTAPRPAIILRNRSKSSFVVILKLPSSPGIMTMSIPSMIAGSVEPLMRRIASGSNRLLACRYLPSKNISGACPAKTVLLSKRDVIERPSALQ